MSFPFSCFLLLQLCPRDKEYLQSTKSSVQSPGCSFALLRTCKIFSSCMHQPEHLEHKLKRRICTSKKTLVNRQNMHESNACKTFALQFIARNSSFAPKRPVTFIYDEMFVLCLGQAWPTQQVHLVFGLILYQDIMFKNRDPVEIICGF